MFHYLFKVVEQNRRMADSDTREDTTTDYDPKWEDEDPYGEGYDPSHLFGDESEPVWDPDAPDSTP